MKRFVAVMQLRPSVCTVNNDFHSFMRDAFVRFISATKSVICSREKSNWMEMAARWQAIRSRSVPSHPAESVTRPFKRQYRWWDRKMLLSFKKSVFNFYSLLLSSLEWLTEQPNGEWAQAYVGMAGDIFKGAGNDIWHIFLILSLKLLFLLPNSRTHISIPYICTCNITI